MTNSNNSRGLFGRCIQRLFSLDFWANAFFIIFVCTVVVCVAIPSIVFMQTLLLVEILICFISFIVEKVFLN